jgi:hypothetical protein
MLGVETFDVFVDISKTNHIGIIHWAAAPFREAVTGDVTYIDIARPLGDALLQNTPNTFNQNPAHYVAFEGTITDNGLSFAAYGGTWNYRFKIRPDGMMDGQTDGPQNHHPTITIERIN